MVTLVCSIPPPVCTGETHDSVSPEGRADQVSTTFASGVNSLAVEDSWSTLMANSLALAESPETVWTAKSAADVDLGGDTASTAAFWWQRLVAHLAGDEVEKTAVAAKGPDDNVPNAHCGCCGVEVWLRCFCYG